MDLYDGGNMAAGDDGIRYLNLEKIGKEEKSAKKLMKVGCILVCIFGIAILGALFKIDGSTEEKTRKDMEAFSGLELGSEEMTMITKFLDVKNMSPLYLSVILLIPSAIPIFVSRKKFREIASARRYETIFGSDTDGIITAYELSIQLRRPDAKIFSELERLFAKGYFQNCSLQKGENPCVKIDNALGGGTIGTGFVEIKCPSCGAPNRIREGSHGKCSYCENPLFGKI